jgi:excinuclease ABC subunit C
MPMKQANLNHQPSEDALNKLASVSSEPGVYLMRDAEGHILYVGKARHLKKRLSAYFKVGRITDPKVAALVDKIADFDTIITRTEKEALILESNLIKEHRPRYNVVLKDDKRYPSLRLNPRETYPGFTVVRKIGEDDALYFGPFASAHAVRETLNVINKTFKLRKCKAAEFRSRTRPCLHCQMNGCLAPCCRDVSPEIYQEQVQEAVLFLKGRTSELIRKIRAEMDQAAEVYDYEKAARLRDKLLSIQRTLEKQAAVSTDFQDRDVFAAAASSGSAVITHLSVRGGFLTETRNFFFRETVASEAEMLGVFICQFYDRSPSVPAEILVSHGLEDADLVEEWLADGKALRVRLVRPERGEKARLVGMARRNADAALAHLLQGRSSIQDLLARLQKHLGLNQFPERIECFDNSNLMGADPVSSMVVFSGGQPDRPSYRKYRIRAVEVPDDYASMSETLMRRFGKAEASRPFPNLLIVDGGRGQLGIVLAVMKELGLKGAFDVLAIAKKDERKGEVYDKIFIPGRTNPVNFGRGSDLLLFLQRVRDEAHRFAVAFHRQRRRQSTLRSALDDVPGIGKARKAALIRRFTSLETIRSATLGDLMELPGFNRRLAEAVQLALLKNTGENGKA